MNTPHGIIGPLIPVLTKSGWKPIHKIKKGAQVLTHMGRWRKIKKLIHTTRQTVDPIRVHFGWARFLSLAVAPSHLFMVNGNWTPACEIEQGDIIRILGYECTLCNRLVPHYKDYCSIRCLNRHRHWKDTDEMAVEAILRPKRKIPFKRKRKGFVEKEIQKTVQLKYKHKQMLYNFSVEEDESYLVRGVVVHS